MLLSIISSSLHPPCKPLHPFLHHPRTSKHPILITNLLSRRSIAAKSSVSDQREMTELARADVLGDSGSSEREAVLANGSVGIVSDVAWRKVESIINRMSKWLVAGLFGLVILWRHDAEAMWASMGSVVNSWLSITLKQMLNHQRPNSALRSDPGMPSSHAQSIFYAASYAVLSLHDSFITYMEYATYTLFKDCFAGMGHNSMLVFWVNWSNGWERMYLH